MPAMNESEVYQYLTQNGDSLPAIKKNTEMLRQHFTIEAQRVAHALSQLDPYNKDRHQVEAQRIYQENNAALDRVLMHIASTTPQKMPIPVEGINKASVAAKIPKNQAKAVLTFPFVLFMAFPAALFYTIALFVVVGLVVLVALVVNAFTLKMDISGMKEAVATVGFWVIAKITYWICYVFAVFLGFSHVRGGGSFGEVFMELFLNPITSLAEMFNGIMSAGKR